MKLFWMFYFAICMVLIGLKQWNHIKSKKKGKRKEVEPENEEGAPQNTTEKKKEDLQFTLETVNSWVNNCDQKVGILLAVVGVAITVLITSNFLKNLRKYIFKPFMDYWVENQDLSFSWSRFTVFLFLLIAVGMLIASCYHLFHAMSANIDYQKMRDDNPKLAKTSYIFFGSISGMTYDDFKKEKIDYLDDLKSQIYVNSKIASAKFMNYNKGLYWFKFMLIVSSMLFIAIMFMK